jgi:hypothetical protein
MTPEKLLDYSVKFGVLPFMLYMIVITRNDLEEVKERLYDCYEDRIVTEPMQRSKFPEPLNVVAVLPCEVKIRKA